MSQEQPEDLSNLIFIGHREYTSEWARFYDLVARKVGQELDTRAQTPNSVEQAFIFKYSKTYLGFKEFWDELIAQEHIGSLDTADTWHGQSIPQLADRLQQAALDDEYESGLVSQWTQFTEAATAQIDTKDTHHIQMVVMQHMLTQNPFGRAFDASTYAYLVVYPDGTREMSFPTAMCHALDAAALLQEATVIRALGSLHRSQVKSKPHVLSMGENKLRLRSFKINPLSDEQLLADTNKRGTTIVDKLIQAGLSLRDKAKGIKGEHIDAFRALADENWAIKYALACHRGLGYVINQKINLPPINI